MFNSSRNMQGRPFLNQGQLDILARANRQVASKKPGDAARLFTQLASEMEATDHYRRAANYHAMAALSYADALDEKKALAHAQSAMNLFIEYQMVRRIHYFYPNITSELLAHNMMQAVEALHKEFDEKFSSMPAAATDGLEKRGRLPTNCPKCGALVHSQDINWIDDQSAECIYCGSMIQTL
jgi:hypothetical protein